MKNILKHISSSSETLPQSQRRVAEFVLEHYNQVPFLTLVAMANQIGVSDTTVINFCLNVGFSGFANFKKEFTNHIQSEFHSQNNMETHIGEIAPESAISLVMQCDQNNIEETMNNPINRENFYIFLDQIVKAKNIYIMGNRTSSLLAELLAQSLRIQGFKIIPFDQNGNAADQLCQLSADDLFIAFSFSRYSLSTIRALTYLAEKKIPTVSFTDAMVSPSYSLADISFVCHAKSFSYQASYAGALTLINAIVTASALLRKEETTAHLKKTNDTLMLFDTFWESSK